MIIWILSSISHMILTKRHIGSRIKIEYNHLIRMLGDKQSVVTFCNPESEVIAIKINRRVFREIQQINIPRRHFQCGFMLKQLCRNGIAMIDNRFNNILTQLTCWHFNNMYPISVCDIADIVPCSITKINNCLAAFNMAAANLNNLIIRLKVTVINNDHTAIASKVRFNNVSTIIPVCSKIGLDMTLLIKEFSSDSIVYTVAQDGKEIIVI